MEVRVTFGPPGTGKTTAMLDRVAEHLEAGVAPGRIAFVSYTRKAVIEAKERAAERFGMNPKEFHAFRTIHSTAYHALRIRRDEMMGNSDYAAIGNLLGVKFGSKRSALDGLTASDDTGDYMLQLINLSNARGVDLREVWNTTDRELDWFRLRQMQSTLEQYKQDMLKVDFDDLLLTFARERPYLDVDAAVIDEAQDLSNAQWNVAKCAFRKASYIDIAGDDDQAIYCWSGANVERFLSIRGTSRVLDKSYRLPRTVHRLAATIVSRISHRHAKHWEPKDADGSVTYLNDEWQVDLSSGEWLLLARNGYLLNDLRELCIARGLAYFLNGSPSVNQEDVQAIAAWVRRQRGEDLSQEQTTHLKKYTRDSDLNKEWYDALTRIPATRREYYLSILRQGGRLQDPPRITISTIHGIKGGEADNVLLLTDMANRTYESMQAMPDNEHRVFYVGVTRAKQNLHIVQPKSERGYLL